MKMSKGQMAAGCWDWRFLGRHWLAGGAAFAEVGQPAPWEYTLQPSASPVMDNIAWFHNFSL